MSRFSYAGSYQNPTTGWFVKEVQGHFEVWLRADRASDGSCPADRPLKPRRRFDEADEAQDYIDCTHTEFEDDYYDYLDEHHDEIVQQERREAHLAER